MELNSDQRRALMDRIDAWNEAPAGPQAGAAWDVLEAFVAGLMQEGDGERQRLAENCEMLAAMYDKASKERHALRGERDRLMRMLADRAALETPVYIVNLGRVEMPADWHALAAEELARAEVSTAGHGDLHDGGAR